MGKGPKRADPVFVGRRYHIISLLQTKYPTIYITRSAANHMLCYFADAAEADYSPGLSCFFNLSDENEMKLIFFPLKPRKTLKLTKPRRKNDFPLSQALRGPKFHFGRNKL